MLQHEQTATAKQVRGQVWELMEEDGDSGDGMEGGLGPSAELRADLPGSVEA